MNEWVSVCVCMWECVFNVCVSVWKLTHSLLTYNLFIHSITSSLARSFAHSHTLTHLLIPLFTHALPSSLTYSFLYSLIHSLNHSHAGSIIYIRAFKHKHIHARTHTRDVNPTEQLPCCTSWITLMPAVLKLWGLTIQKVFIEKEFVISVLKTSTSAIKICNKK